MALISLLVYVPLLEADAEVCQRAILSVKRYFPTSDLHNNVADAVVPRSLSIRRSERKQRVVSNKVSELRATNVSEQRSQ